MKLTKTIPLKEVPSIPHDGSPKHDPDRVREFAAAEIRSNQEQVAYLVGKCWGIQTAARGSSELERSVPPSRITGEDVLIVLDHLVLQGSLSPSAAQELVRELARGVATRRPSPAHSKRGKRAL